MRDEQTTGKPAHVTLTVTPDEALFIMELIMDQPFRAVAPLMQKVMTEVNSQMAEASPAARAQIDLSGDTFVGGPT